MQTNRMPSRIRCGGGCECDTRGGWSVRVKGHVALRGGMCPCGHGVDGRGLCPRTPTKGLRALGTLLLALSGIGGAPYFRRQRRRLPPAERISAARVEKVPGG
ncbi:hypothetical protein GCM10011320_41960 [Neoroseomonas lacus]|uniref:Uncharacterized protein n=1 Tax=Neoroseomonas lacus TaxID=287609 RepID=A0A917KWF6_9PROT|nr:hypothetical protein GCM10011320_41960 [Neoroseomonas lacus]